MYRIEVEGMGVEFECSPERSLLAGMEAQAKKAIAVGCRGGGCGFCKIRILEGEYETKKMSVKFVSHSERLDGYALSCRVFPRSDMRVVALEDVEGKKIIETGINKP
ncbi:MAG: 2Fe-2S iron-sulfur cluster-binding protein [Arenicellales bacterium]